MGLRPRRAHGQLPRAKPLCRANPLLKRRNGGGNVSLPAGHGTPCSRAELPQHTKTGELLRAGLAGSAAVSYKTILLNGYQYVFKRFI